MRERYEELKYYLEGLKEDYAELQNGLMYTHGAGLKDPGDSIFRHEQFRIPPIPSGLVADTLGFAKSAEL